MDSRFDMSAIYKNVVKCFAYLSLIIELSKGRKITGYDILVQVKSYGLEVSPGTIYYQLGILEKSGIIRSSQVIRSNASKTVYEITDKGMKVFKEFKDKWEEPLRYVYRNIVG